MDGACDQWGSFNKNKKKCNKSLESEKDSWIF